MTLLHQAAQKAVEAALRRAFGLGQTYWQQADSESFSQHRKADITADKFESLVDETLSALQQQEVPREPVANPSEQHFRERIDAYADKHPSLLVRQLGTLLRAAWLAASPSTTQQQEAGSIPPAKLVNGQWTGVPISRFPELQEQVRKGLADGTLSIGGAATPSTPESAEKDDAGGGKGAGPVRLWAMHIAGPDDVHAAPGEAEARAAAERFNAWFAQRKDPHPLDPQMHATAIEWPHSAEAHANDLPRWRDFVPPAAGVEGKCECGLSEVACRDPLRRSCPDGVPASRSEPTPPRGNDGGEHA